MPAAPPSGMRWCASCKFYGPCASKTCFLLGELLKLLGEAEGMLQHTRCIDDDAMRCPACSLESRISAALKGGSK